MVQLTSSNNQQSLFTGTWNDASTVFTAWKLNVTDTASNANSLLLDLQVGGSSKVGFNKSGFLVYSGQPIVRQIAASTALLSVTGGAGVFIGPSGSTTSVGCYANINNGITIQGASAFAFAAGSDTSEAQRDVILLRDAAATLAQRNSTNAQTFRVYNTFTDASNYERGKFGWNTNVLEIGTEAGGTGTVRNINLIGGRVGVGVSPTAKLDVVETSNQAPLRIQNSQNTQHSGWELYVGYPGNYDGYLLFRRAGQALPGAMSIAQNDSVTVWNSLSVADGKEIGSATGIGLAHYLPYRNTTGISGQITFRNYLTNAALFSFNGYYYDGTTYNLIPSILNIRQASATDARVGVGTTTPSGKFAVADTVLSGSGSLATSLVDLTQTWNTSGTPTAIKLNVTDTASNAASLLMDLQTGGTSRFTVSKSGSVVAGINASITSASGGSRMVFGIGSTTVAGLGLPGGAPAVLVGSNGIFCWAGTTDPGNSDSVDVKLFRDAAATVAQRNGTNAQTFRVYNTFTDASNYERGKIEWVSNVLRIGTEKGGTGTARALEFQTDGTQRMLITSTGQLNYSGRANFNSSLLIETGGARVPNSYYFGFTAAANPGDFSGNDPRFYYDDVHVIGQRNTTNPQTLRIYNTHSSSTNYERGKIEWASNVLRIGTEKGSAGGTARALEIQTDAVTRLTVGASGSVTIADANDIAVGTTTGTKIGTATGQKLGFWNAAPVAQPTTAVAEATVVANAGAVTINDDTTFDGYTLAQIVKALRDTGLLA